MDEQFWRDIRQGLTDAANRGVVGGLLGMPVDMATGVLNAGLMGGGYLGNKLGLLTADQLPQPIENPVGGSEWLGQKMQDAGMVSENRNPVAETLMGLLGPSAITKGGKAVYAMEQNAAMPSPLNAAMRGQLGATLWHGSPHKFDRFDMSKVGTGEGAQAYGHGLYAAEEKGVGKGYQEALSGLLPSGWSDKYPESARGYIRGMVGDVASGATTAERAVQHIQNANSNMRSYPADKLATELAEGAAHTKGYLYKVDLPDEHIAKMLDWDKPLSQQPESVRKAVESLVGQRGPLNDPKTWGWKNPDSIRGVDIYNILERGSQAHPGAGRVGASEALRAQGVPGIRYLDAGSRGKGKGSSNYVVFDDQLLKIVGTE
jgi:hypothetical protein